ncbi:ATP-binding protein [Hephaestia sp. GCM10023244]|uniref:sensor histidine kinase n=1 Tax=unclassified Hephaestia TaxID=2631281 RepID=UPI002076E0E2|nr:HAMP domain-containing sensor histidine kinase [Hephaestia sp. MAHUQ-44]MCM8731522.1 HAMP domain-containing histidine kinase [Hephaestia sp. MAHUQ-44]
MNLKSLRFRLLAGGAVAVAVALVAAWFFLTLLFEHHLERRLADELQRDGVRLVSGLTVGPGGSLAVAEGPRDERFTVPASGLYWQASSARTMLRSRSLWDQALPTSSRAQADDWSERIDAGPFEPRLMLLERRILLGGGSVPVLVQIGQDAQMVTSAAREFGRELAIFLAILWLALSLAAWAQVALGLRPLARIQTALDRLRRSPSERLAAEGPAEVQPLIDAINALADVREADLDRARRRAADLAHGLKTPLAALAAQSRRARAAGAIEAADGLDRAIAAVRGAIEAELARTRIASVRRDAGLSCPARAVAEQVVAVLERTEHGETLAFEVDLDDALRLPLSAEDLTELLGAAAENAARYARRRVRLWGAAEGARIMLAIDDDGPGLTPDDADAALERGARLDRGGGQGLGLAIVRDVAEATGGSVTLARAEMGGLRVAISWPR